MPRSKRIPKTLQRKVADLDDHCYLLAEARHKLASGEVAYLKSLAAELRVLVCHSSGTEGLLWRLVEELGVLDAVHVHLAGNVDRNHPRARELSFAFVPIFPAGQGHPHLPPRHYSLKSIIKECDAVFISGLGYTHEQLIKGVSQQMGSAHEAEGVEPHLLELGEMVLGNQTALTQILTSDAAYVLEVGDRVIDQASKSLNFRRKSRPRFVAEKQVILDPPPEEQQSEGEAVALPSEGTIVFSVSHPHQDWCTNQQAYSFGRIVKGPIAVVPQKHPDGTMELDISGLTGQPLTIRRPIPASEQPGVTVAITWTESKITVYLNGQQVELVSCVTEG